MVLRRFHHRVGLWENARYRWRLLRVRRALWHTVKCSSIDVALLCGV